MSLEATMILIDNSSCAINGDYLPNRLETQVNSLTILLESKINANAQSSVGVGLMGGKQVQILCTMTSDPSKAISALYGIKSHGTLHFSQALQIAALSLKHRSNETQKQRIICFVGSSIDEDVETLKILGKKLKKNMVAVDLVCFGDCSETQRGKIEAFSQAVKQEGLCSSLFIEPGNYEIVEKLFGTDILGGNAGGSNPVPLQEEDPELAAAIRMSLQENQNRAAVPVASRPEGEREPTEEQLQQLAIRMSLQEMDREEKKQEKERKNEEERE